jgi:hypothetical protein
MGKFMVCWQNLQLYWHMKNWGLQLSVEILNQHYDTALVAGWPEFEIRDGHSQTKRLSDFITFKDIMMCSSGGGVGRKQLQAASFCS